MQAEGWVQFIGNATLLINYGPLTILTDPNFVHRGAEVALGFDLSATRTTDPARDVEDVSQPDLVILSHDHGDHFDAVAADWLNPRVPVLPSTAPALVDRGFGDVRPLATWESATLARDGVRLRVTAAPARHGPVPVAAAMPEVMGSVLELWSGASTDEDGANDDDGAPADLRSLPEFVAAVNEVGLAERVRYCATAIPGRWRPPCRIRELPASW